MTTDCSGESIGARLARIAAREQDRVAVVEGDARIGYRDLDRAASGVAARIVVATAGRDGPLCLFFECKLATVVAIFGAARSGRAYVPLDAGDPQARLAAILDDCAPVALLTDARLAPRAQALAPSGCTVIAFDDVARERSTLSLADVAGDAALYIHYTSGSTGAPKGALQTHANVLFYADVYARALRIVPADRMSLVYTMSFAAGNGDVVRALTQGATLCGYDLRRDGIAPLADWLDRERVSVLHMPPTAFREFAGRLAPSRILPHLRALHLGGEPVFANDVRLFRERTLPHCILVNHLASTEAGVIAQHVVDHASALPSGPLVPAGRAVDGVRIEIHRDDGSLADVEEVGEIVVASRHVSPGYWRRPELDRTTFADVEGEPGVRRYRTRDLGRLDAEGRLHFVGRSGSRVKIRGYSVDLAEVEATLATCPLVEKAAVVAIDEGSQANPTRLVAYAVARSDAARDPQSVRRHVAAMLPLYMLPARIHYLDALPLTATGKVDRNALATMRPLVAGARELEAPRDDVERAIADIFAEMLALDTVGRDDDFFLQGGDSLLSVELEFRVAEAFGVRVGNFHRGATVASIAACVRAIRDDPQHGTRCFPVLIPLWTHGRAPPLFLVHGRHGQAFVSPHFMRLLGDDQPVWAFQARGLDGVSAAHVSVDDMAADYLGELRKVRAHGPYFLGSLCAGVYIVASIARALRAAGEDVLPLLLLDPPNSVSQPGYWQISEDEFVAKMQARHARGTTAGPTEDPVYMQAVIRTTAAFEQAIAKHRPLPYDGAVYVLSSHQRMHRDDPLALRRIFTGRYKRYEVGETHAAALDPRNPVFASTLRRCVGLILDAARSCAPEGELTPESREPVAKIVEGGADVQRVQ
ncbi:MAG TPA: AMP-binding protein [Casimicrobiaceae bacterium]|nr:AMP-binding protein [Casimicrobiaceae bacterium]